MSEPLRNSELLASYAPTSDRRRPLVLGSGHPAREEAEELIRSRFRKVYGADITVGYPTLLALRDETGAVTAAAGVRRARTDRLFLETYLDEPLEQAVAEAFGCPVARDQIAEIGSFAAAGAEEALELFSGLATWLADAGHRFAVATARPELRKLLHRSGFGLRILAPADPDRLGAAADDWGAYYSAQPQVCVGEISGGEAVTGLLGQLRQRRAGRSR